MSIDISIRNTGSFTRTNLCTNSNFETSTAGWNAESGATLSRDTTTPISGTASGVLTSGTAGAGDCYTAVTVNAGDTITFSLDLQTVGALTGSPRIYINSPGTGSQYVYLPLNVATATRYSITQTATSAGTVICAVFTGSTVGNAIRFDNVLIEKAAFAGPYLDGGSPNAVWNGTPNLSTSTQVVTTSTALTDATSYSVVEDATPIDPSSSSGGFGQITIVAPDFDGSVQTEGLTVTLSDGAHGITEGTITTLDSDEFMLTVTANSQLALLDTTVSAAPYSGTLGGYFAYLLGLIGVTTGFQVDSTITGNAVAFPGWQGNLWDYVKMLCAGQQVEVTFVSDNIVMRPIRQNTAVVYRDERRAWRLDNSNIAQRVSCFYYQSVQQTNGIAYPLGGNLKSNTTVQSVDANQTLKVTIPLTPTASNGTGLGVSLSSVQQPVCVDNMAINYTGASAYTVIGNDNNPYPASQWTSLGGSLSVAIGADNASIVLTLTGPNDVSLAPFRLELADPTVPNVYYSSLYLLGTGVFYNKQLFTLQTGNSVVQTSTVAPPTIDNFSITTVSDARSAALRAASAAQGPTQTLTVSSTGINTAGVSDSYTQMTMGQFDSHFAAGTFGAFDSQFPNATFSSFDTWAQAQVAGQFDNQAFGNVAGARVFYKNAWYRIASTTITPFGLTYTAVADTTMGDFDAIWANQTFGAFDAIWSTRTFGQFTPSPLKSS